MIAGTALRRAGTVDPARGGVFLVIATYYIG